MSRVTCDITNQHHVDLAADLASGCWIVNHPPQSEKIRQCYFTTFLTQDAEAQK